MAKRKTPQKTQSELSQKALDLVQAAAPPMHPETGDTPNPGTVSLPRPDQPPSGAFDAEGQRPVLERSRKVR
jgi:hypothetical protein